MSDANRTKVSYVPETTLGTTPATPAWKSLRVTGTSLSFKPLTTTSNELVSDRQFTDLVRVGQEVGGGVDAEFSWTNLDQPLETAFFNAWVQTPYRSNNGTADSIITDVTSTVATFTNPAAEATGQGTLAVGHLVTTSGFGVAGNNVNAIRITAASATTATITGFASEAVVPAAARIKVVGLEGAASDLSITLASSVFYLNSAAPLNFATLGIVPGMWIKLGGAAVGTQFATAANNDWVRVASTVSAGVVSLDRTPTSFAADSGTSKTIRVWFGDYLRNGTTKKSISIEQQYADLVAPEYDTLAGMVADTFDLTADTQSIKTASLMFVGMSATNSTSRFAGSTDVSTTPGYDYLGTVPRAGDVFNTSSNVARIAENGTAITTNYVQSFSLNLTNSLRRQNAVGTLASIGIGAGRCAVTGSLKTYYFSNGIRTKILAGTATALDVRLADPDGVRYVHIDLPRVKFSDGTPEGIVVDSDRTLTASYQALKDPTLGYTIQLQRYEQIA